MSKAQLQAAAMFRCPQCDANNAVPLDVILLTQEQIRDVMISQGAMREEDQLPEDAGLENPLTAVNYPDLVTCHECDGKFLAIHPDPLGKLKLFEPE